jgi:hypothetical protein
LLELDPTSLLLSEEQINLVTLTQSNEFRVDIFVVIGSSLSAIDFDSRTADLIESVDNGTNNETQNEPELQWEGLDA